MYTGDMHFCTNNWVCFLQMRKFVLLKVDLSLQHTESYCLLKHDLDSPIHILNVAYYKAHIHHIQLSKMNPKFMCHHAWSHAVNVGLQPGKHMYYKLWISSNYV